MIEHQFTKEELQFQEQLLIKQKIYLEAQKEYCNVLWQCKHVIVPRDKYVDEKLKTDIWASTGAICAICGKNFGWWCPKSPDHLCHYSKSEDDCDYCHMPDERK